MSILHPIRDANEKAQTAFGEAVNSGHFAGRLTQVSRPRSAAVAPMNTTDRSQQAKEKSWQAN
ncbi:hypothetical protein [Microlunatus antarcticus]|uniref:Uncharacterized protein n=1 Tax=Microlunatus antarcticus TaxID=53388 RepID=A0A7W5JVZ8_9ACTN|nr:hypothetical protein [Microlunatus antarcticus]MBB3327086.1 hypothetical protein [Microlunatus antarcticus]